eukprot:SAG31_NODE_1098_length_9919_cov_2.877495_3_plen_223_part_00
MYHQCQRVGRTRGICRPIVGTDAYVPVIAARLAFAKFEERPDVIVLIIRQDRGPNQILELVLGARNGKHRIHLGCEDLQVWPDAWTMLLVADLHKKRWVRLHPAVRDPHRTTFRICTTKAILCKQRTALRRLHAIVQCDHHAPAAMTVCAKPHLLDHFQNLKHAYNSMVGELGEAVRRTENTRNVRCKDRPSVWRFRSPNPKESYAYHAPPSLGGRRWGSPI